MRSYIVARKQTIGDFKRDIVKLKSLCSEANLRDFYNCFPIDIKFIVFINKIIFFYTIINVYDSQNI
jgi:hypothetical protein